jgi:ribonuclease P protein component
MRATKEDMKILDRLKKRSDFLRVSYKGKKWVAKGLIVLACEGEQEKIRFGVTATKKLEKTAVGRNRMKRRLRAVAANVLPFHSKLGTDYVLIARQDTLTRDFRELEKDLRWCIGKLGHAWT